MASKYDNQKLITSFYLIWIGGCAGVLVDLDHVIGPLFGLPGRFMHAPVMYLSGLIIGCVSAYITGQIFILVLRR